MMRLQQFLRDGGTPEQLKQRYAIETRRHGTFPNLVLFKYSQIESPMGDPLVRECRGVILDEAAGWKVVARPFDKFFNYGEGHAAEIDWSTARVQEKLDGSLCTLYWYEGDWRVATSGSPDASGPVGDRGFTFADLFWRVFLQVERYKVPREFEDVTFMFELTTPYNEVVVHHDHENLTLIGARGVVTGNEYPVHPGMLEWSAFNPVRSFPLGSIEQIEETFRQLDPLKQEGYVVVDAKFNRVKVKHPGYIALHHLKDSLGSSKKHLLEVVRTGEKPELLTAFPAFVQECEEIERKYNALVADLEATYSQALANVADTSEFTAGLVRDALAAKQFAQVAKTARIPSVLFNRFRFNRPIRQSLAEMSIDHLAAALEI